MAYVYRYTDMSDNIIKYVGIVWSNNRSLRQRIKEHELYDEWCKNKLWKIEFLTEDIDTRTDAEYFESHYISLFKTDRYYNIKKANWGVSSFLPTRDNWQVYDTEKDKEIEDLKKRNDILESKLKKIQIELDSAKNDLDNVKKENEYREEYLSSIIKQMRNGTKTGVRNYNLKKKEVPEFILNENLYLSFESKKNKSKNDLRNVISHKSGYFKKRKSLNSPHYSIPCKLILYKNKKKIGKRYFDSIKECSVFTGLSTYQITDSMLYQEYNTYFYWNNGYIGCSKIDDYSYQDKLYIRVCAITPKNEVKYES